MELSPRPAYIALHTTDKDKMLFLALIIFAGPLIGMCLSFGTGLQLTRERRPEGPLLLIATALFATISAWEFRYDIGLALPDLSWMPSGANAEATLLYLAAALAALLLFAGFKWPEQRKGRWMALLGALLWGLAAAAFLALSGVDFSH